MKKKGLKNWKTTINGLIGGVALIITGIKTANNELIVAGVTMVGLGFESKDINDKIEE